MAHWRARPDCSKKLMGKARKISFEFVSALTEYLFKGKQKRAHRQAGNVTRR